MFKYGAGLSPRGLAGHTHDVSGTVTLVDADTFRVDNFYDNGGGINVHFILAAANDYNAFRTTTSTSHEIKKHQQRPACPEEQYSPRPGG